MGINVTYAQNDEPQLCPFCFTWFGHELGHTGGLDHWFKGTPNLMQEGSKREYDTRTITLDQIKKIYEESQAGNLNKGSSKIGGWEYAHLPKEERDK